MQPRLVQLQRGGRPGRLQCRRFDGVHVERGRNRHMPERTALGGGLVGQNGFDGAHRRDWQSSRTRLRRATSRRPEELLASAASSDRTRKARQILSSYATGDVTASASLHAVGRTAQRQFVPICFRRRPGRSEFRNDRGNEPRPCSRTCAAASFACASGDVNVGARTGPAAGWSAQSNGIITNAFATGAVTGARRHMGTHRQQRRLRRHSGGWWAPTRA